MKTVKNSEIERFTKVMTDVKFLLKHLDDKKFVEALKMFNEYGERLILSFSEDM